MGALRFSTFSVAAAMALGSCSSKTTGSDTTPTQPTTSASTQLSDDAGSAASPDAGATESAEDVLASDEVVDERAARLQALSKLEVTGMTRSRGTVQRELVTLAFDTAPNAKGNVGAVELTVAACDPCSTPTVAETEGRKDMLLQQLGELHAKNPDLVFAVNALELAPARTGTATYARSYVDDGTTRASVHTLEVQFADNGFAFRFQAYPRGGFPTSGEELASAFSQAELEAAVQRVFVAASAVLWPPSTPE